MASDHAATRELQIAGACAVDLGPIIIAAASLLGGGGVAYFLRELIWLRLIRYLHDQAVARGQNPDPAQLIEAARAGRPALKSGSAAKAITAGAKKKRTKGK